MGSNISVKVSGIRNLTSARYFAARNVDFLGFCIDTGHAAYLPPDKITEILNWVEGPEFVLEALKLTPNVSDIAAFVNIQNIHLTEPVHAVDFQNWKTVFVEIGLNQILHAEWPEICIPIIQFAGSPEDLDEHQSTVLTQACKKQTYYLDFAWAQPRETFDFLLKTGCVGVVVHGSDDIQTGFQDFDWMDEFLDLLEK